MGRFKSTLEEQHIYKIAGFDVQFPMKPYGPQFTFMHKMLTTLELSRTSSSANALLESPTGTGKSLALLCAALAWQQHSKQHGCPPSVLPADAASRQSNETQAPVANGGGFLPDLNATPNAEDGAPESSETSKQGAKKEAKRSIPKIYYATRTHSQLGQVVRELSKTGYRTSMAILAARKHYCTHKTISRRKDVNEECKNLLLEPNGCSYNRNMVKVKTHPSLQHGAVHEIHDIEDLVKIGKQVQGCSYFASRALAAEASIVFCPYNYIIDPVIRKAMEIDIKNSIVILDEAHNIEDVAREAASTTVDLVALDEVRLELQKMVHEEGQMETYQPLIDMTEGIIAWIEEKSRSLKKDGPERFHSEWFSDRLLAELESAGVQPQSLNILLSCFQEVSQHASEATPGELHVSGPALSTMEGLFTSLKFLLSNEARRLNDFSMVLQKSVKRGEGIRGTVWTTELSLWCLNPAVAFEEVAKAARSIILTSGTLSPLDSFEKELGCKFSVTMEGSHVIDMDKQIWGGVVGIGPNDVVLNASYRHADGADFQDSLGLAIEESARIVPDGLLVFFPSYKLMEKLSARWKSTGQWQKIAKKKPIYSETRGSDDQFEKVLRGYYSTIKKVQKRRSQTPSLDEEQDSDAGISGAIFFAVCRGKVSEGIDFADGNARAVIVVGIPFPYAMDLQVVFKKQFNTVNQKSRDLQSGDQWYCQQAFRALNQAIGRCIRHQHDFGAVLLFDERFYRASNTQSLSKWLRSSVNKFNSFGESMDSLRTFFRRLELDPPKPAASPPAPATAAVEPSQDSGKFHPMFNKALDPTTGQPRSANCTQNNNRAPAPESDSPSTVGGFAEKLSGFRAGPSGKPDALEQTTGYVRKYEATQPTRDAGRQPKKSPFWNEEGFVDPPSARQETAESSRLLQGATEPLDMGSLLSLETLVAECREEESQNVLQGGARSRKVTTGEQTGFFELRTEPGVGMAEPLERNGWAVPSNLQSVPLSGLRETGGAACPVECPSRNLSEPTLPTVSPPDGGATGSSLCCNRCGSVVADSSSTEPTRTFLQKSFLQGLLERNKSIAGPSFGDGTVRPGVNGSRNSLYPIEVLVVDSGDVCSSEGQQKAAGQPLGREQSGAKAGGIWVEEDGCVFEPVDCSGCVAGGLCLGLQVLAADKANSYFNGQALLFPELLAHGPSVPPTTPSDPATDNRAALPGSFSPALPSQSPLQSIPCPTHAQPPPPSSLCPNLGPVEKPRPYVVPRSSPWPARDLPSWSQPPEIVASNPSTATAEAAYHPVQTDSPVGPAFERLYFPAADLPPRRDLSQARCAPATSAPYPPHEQPFPRAESAWVRGSREAEACPVGQPASVPRAPKPLYVPSSGAKRASLAGVLVKKGAAVLSASEANILNGREAGGFAAEGGQRPTPGEAQRVRGNIAAAPKVQAKPRKARGNKDARGGAAAAAASQSKLLPGSGPKDTPLRDVSKGAAGKKRKHAARAEEQMRTREVISETDSDEGNAARETFRSNGRRDKAHLE